MRYHLIATLGRYIARIIAHLSRLIRMTRHRMPRWPAICWGRCPATVSGPAVILFPCSVNRLCCGLAGIIAVKGEAGRESVMDLSRLAALLDTVDGAGLKSDRQQTEALADGYLGGQKTLGTLLAAIQSLKQEAPFLNLFNDPAARNTLAGLSVRLSAILQREQTLLVDQAGSLAPRTVDVISTCLDTIKDMCWCLDEELAGNIGRIQSLTTAGDDPAADRRITVFRQINAVLNSIDRLEVRGRDSAGISILFQSCRTRPTTHFLAELAGRPNR
jgi:glucosamine--fructose-6-phosphate aminotransferase (isomerizing)